MAVYETRAEIEELKKRILELTSENEAYKACTTEYEKDFEIERKDRIKAIIERLNIEEELKTYKKPNQGQPKFPQRDATVKTAEIEHLKNENDRMKLEISRLNNLLSSKQKELDAVKANLEAMEDIIPKQLKAFSVQLTEAKEEIAVKGAQVKQYQKQVEAYMGQCKEMTTETYWPPSVYIIPFLEGLAEKLERGRGSFGAVYEVKLNGAPCIAKGLHEILLGLGGSYQVADSDKQAIQQKFFNECVLLSKLKHPNIVQFLGIHSTKENEYLVMECMHMDLAQCLKTYQDIPASIKVSILHDVSCGLLHLHSQDPPIIHRDLTAVNILLTQDMKAKIADLGVSKIFDLQQLQKTTAPGTKSYMPPEALIPHPEYDFKLDIFSFGVLSLYLAVQEFPIEHEDITVEVVVKKEIQIYKRKHWIEMMGVDHPLHPLVIKCLQDRPELRPTTKELCEIIGSIIPQHKKEWKNLLELYKEVQALKSKSNKITSRNEGHLLHLKSSN